MLMVKAAVSFMFFTSLFCVTVLRRFGLQGLSWPLAALSFSAASAASAPVQYQLELHNLAHHEARVHATFADLKAEPLKLQMAAASPGRYARHDFAKNVYDLSASNSTGQALEVVRNGPSAWQVAGHDGTVNLSYTLFADHADGTYSQLDINHAHLNIPASFIWSAATADRPVQLSFKQLPAAWRIASQLQSSAAGLLTAPNLDYFMDSPIEASAHHFVSFDQVSNNKSYQIQLAVHHLGEIADLAPLVEKVRAVVKVQQQIFGELPDFADNRYTFIADYLPYAKGDGMEHRNSTVVTDERSLLQGEYSQIETMSHEFFHSWNVERLRPANLQPFDFTQPNMSDLLWFAEGFTKYYGKLSLVRSGHYDQKTYLKEIDKALNATLHAPVRQFAGPAAVSQQAVFVDAGISIDANNYRNNFLSYYTYGDVVALALDLTLRAEYNSSLDQLMRAMWQQYGKAERPYTAQDLELQLAKVSADANFARMVFKEWISGQQLPDFKLLLAKFGLELTLKNPEQSYAGELKLIEVGDTLRADSRTIKGSPWYLAGVEQGDQLLQLGRYPLQTKADLELALKHGKAGERLPLHYIQRGVRQQAEITLIKDPTVEIGLAANSSKQQRLLLNDWLKIISPP